MQRLPKAAVLVAAALALAACQHGEGSSVVPGVAIQNAAATSAAAIPKPVLTSSPATNAQDVTPGTPLKLSVRSGSIVSVDAVGAPMADSVAAATGSRPLTLTGTYSKQGSVWVSETPSAPSTSYTVKVRLLDNGGNPSTKTITYATQAAGHRLTLSITPGDKSTVGVGQPISVFFDQPVTDKASVQRALTVKTSRPIGPASWHWFSDKEVQFRPKSFWPGSTTVTVTAALNGVPAGADLWGGRDYSQTFTVGHSVISTVDGKTDMFTVTMDGKVIRTMPTSTGKAGYETWTGTMITSEKEAVIRMNSATVNIFGPQAYNLLVHEAVRLTESGTFVHAAPWDHALGQANTSHGCIHLSTTDATWFFDLSKPGDPVIVSNTGGKQVSPTNGQSSYNMSWTDWTNGSALK